MAFKLQVVFEIQDPADLSQTEMDLPPDMESFGQILKRLRIAQNLTMADLAAKIHDAAWLSALEKGEIAPPVDKVITKMASVLKAPQLVEAAQRFNPRRNADLESAFKLVRQRVGFNAFKRIVIDKISPGGSA